ncbi:MAG: hypothetical protein IJR13_09620 [Bacteroidales bacterium]|nr:hypothetical protein [Bacteroidales bacterium]
MGAFGLGMGIIKTIVGVATSDGEMIAKGLKKTAINTVTTIGDIIVGEFIKNAPKDSDEDIG